MIDRSCDFVRACPSAAEGKIWIVLNLVFWRSFMLMKRMFVFLTAIGMIMMVSCTGGKMDDKKKAYSSIKEVPEAAWKKLAEKRIYFGHQSVGKNILNGVEIVMKENPQIKLKVVETEDPRTLGNPAFAHSRVGKNVDPKSKCDAFVDVLDKGFGEKTDIAFLKFCYVDITAASDAQKVFSDYQYMISSLKKKYPKTTFIHATVPLSTVQTGAKAWIKNLIGMSVYGQDDNVKRGDFNEMLMKEYGGKEPIFDLAGIESTFPDGSRATFKKNGKTYYHLVPEYTKDGGHLNEFGSRLAAERLLALLAGLAS